MVLIFHPPVASIFTAGFTRSGACLIADNSFEPIDP
jgi:hypothetical protein